MRMYELQKREVLHVLRRALPRHHFQHHHETEDSVLHRQPHNTVHGNIIPHGVGVLPAKRQWREGNRYTPTQLLKCFLSYFCFIHRGALCLRHFTLSVISFYLVSIYLSLYL